MLLALNGLNYLRDFTAAHKHATGSDFRKQLTIKKTALTLV